MSSAVRCEGIRFRYPPADELLRGVSVTFSLGVTAVLGPNGSGKSTLLAIVAGRLRASDGVVQRPAGSSRLAAQRPELDPDMTVGEHIELFDALYGAPYRGRDAVVAQFGLRDFVNARVATLSGGNKRRAHLAIAMLGQPTTLALDEPTSGLDQSALAALEAELPSREAVVVISTHDLAFAARVADRFVLMRASGELEVETDLSKLSARYRGAFGTEAASALERGRGQGRRGMT